MRPYIMLSFIRMMAEETRPLILPLVKASVDVRTLVMEFLSRILIRLAVSVIIAPQVIVLPKHPILALQDLRM
jgi:hypothetical protein